MKSNPRVCTWEISVSCIRNWMYCASGSADTLMLLRYQGLRHSEEPPLEITLCVIYPHFSLILHCLVLRYVQ